MHLITLGCQNELCLLAIAVAVAARAKPVCGTPEIGLRDLPPEGPGLGDWPWLVA